MVQPWTCRACGISNQIIVSLLAPPPDSIEGECRGCGRAQEILIPERDPGLEARQRSRKVEHFHRKSSATIPAFPR